MSSISDAIDRSYLKGLEDALAFVMLFSERTDIIELLTGLIEERRHDTNNA